MLVIQVQETGKKFQPWGISVADEMNHLILQEQATQLQELK